MYFSGKSVCTAVPGKLFNYLRSGTPILAPMEYSEAAQIIRKYNAGDVVPPHVLLRDVGRQEPARIC